MSANGSGFTNPYKIYLLQANGDDSVAAIIGGNSAIYFDLDEGVYRPHFFLQDTLTHDIGSGTFTLTDTAGNRVVFFDFGASRPFAQRGQLKEFIDPNGEITSFSYDVNGFVTETQRTPLALDEDKAAIIDLETTYHEATRRVYLE